MPLERCYSPVLESTCTSLGRNAPNAYCTAASAAHTAVSVRRIFAPSATSANPQAAGGRKFRVGPSAFGADRDGHASGIVRCDRDDATGSSTSRSGLAPARSESNNLSGAADARNASRGFAASRQRRDAQAPRLLRGFGEDSLPSFGALPRRGDQALFASLRRERRDFLRAEFRRLFERPLEPVKLHDGQKQFDPNGRNWRRQLLDERELDFVPSHALCPRQPHALARRSVRTIARSPRAARAPDGAPPRRAELPIPPQILPQRIAFACAAMLYQSDGIARPASLRPAVYGPIRIFSWQFLRSFVRRNSQPKRRHGPRRFAAP